MIVWLPTAIDDINDVVAYISAENPLAATIMAARIVGTVDRLASMPRLGRIGRVAGTRELLVPGTPFIVAYRESHGAIEVLRVMHGARRWPDRL